MALDTTEIITKLCEKHPWIAQRYEKIICLFGECSNDEQIQLTSDLLAKFFFVDEGVRNTLYYKMAEYIVSNYDSKTVISAMTVDSAPDSAGVVVNDLKTILYINGLRAIKQVTRLSDITRGARKRKYPECTKVIMVDEFCGSGSTIENRIELIKRVRPDITEIHVCIMTGMKYALNKLREKFPDVNIYFAETLKRGILENHCGEDLIRNYTTMIHMERQLAPTIKEVSIEKYSFGYGNAQALIAFSSPRNIPNSVFPWFWWPLTYDSNKRNHLFIRYEDAL